MIDSGNLGILFGIIIAITVLADLMDYFTKQEQEQEEEDDET